MQRLVRPAMHAEIGLLIAFQPEKADLHGALNGRFGDGAVLAPREVPGLACKQGNGPDIRHRVALYLS